jgi:hypothetical protein
VRVESSVTAISWIPSEAIDGLPKLPFELGIRHYDDPPPERVKEWDLEVLCDKDRYREANRLAAWIDVEDGRIVGYGHEGYGLAGSTTFSFGLTDVTVSSVEFDVLRPDPEVAEDAVRFLQTVGGRAGFPAPRRVKGSPHFRVQSATAWTTLALTIRADGSSKHELVGASPFPRHWIYDKDGNLVQKSGLVDFKAWFREAHGEHTPWGDEESETFVTAAESAVERELSRDLMHGKHLAERRRLEEGEILVEQGQPGDELYLLLDGVLAVSVDGEEVVEIGPGAVVGERAVLEGTRSATLTARTACRVAVVPGDIVDLQELEDLASVRHGADAQP